MHPIPVLNGSSIVVNGVLKIGFKCELVPNFLIGEIFDVDGGDVNVGG